MIENFMVSNRKKYDEDLQESFCKWSCMLPLYNLAFTMHLSPISSNEICFNLENRCSSSNKESQNVMLYRQITIIVHLGLLRHSETVTNIKTWIKYTNIGDCCKIQNSEAGVHTKTPN